MPVATAALLSSLPPVGKWAPVAAEGRSGWPEDLLVLENADADTRKTETEVMRRLVQYLGAPNAKKWNVPVAWASVATRVVSGPEQMQGLEHLLGCLASRGVMTKTTEKASTLMFAAPSSGAAQSAGPSGPSGAMET